MFVNPSPSTSAFLEHSGAEIPILCGAMYPCSNPELVAAASESGAIGVLQPVSLVFAHGYSFEDGLEVIQKHTKRPFGMNVLVEKTVKRYEDRMKQWVEIALRKGVRFFVTALGNRRWVVEQVHAHGGFVYHDVTERKWAELALSHGVDGLICVNAQAGGHAGNHSPEKLFESLKDLSVPLICAGGVSDKEQFLRCLELGYAGVQMGTRFIASDECSAHPDYKKAIVDAHARDIVLTEKISGVPVAVIKTPHVRQVGTRVGRLERFLLRGRKTKHLLRTFYALRSLWGLRKSLQTGSGRKGYLQAGQSVESIHAIEPVSKIIEPFRNAMNSSNLLS